MDPSGINVAEEKRPGKESATTTVTMNDQDVIYVDFEPGDPRDPLTFSKKKKWTITFTACIFSILVCVYSGIPFRVSC